VTPIKDACLRKTPFEEMGPQEVQAGGHGLGVKRCQLAFLSAMPDHRWHAICEGAASKAALFAAFGEFSGRKAQAEFGDRLCA